MSKNIKVSKKLERIARALLEIQLWKMGFPEDRINERVGEAWCSNLDMARNVNASMNLIEDWELDGFTTQENIDKWKSDHE